MTNNPQDSKINVESTKEDWEGRWDELFGYASKEELKSFISTVREEAYNQGKQDEASLKGERRRIIEQIREEEREKEIVICSAVRSNDGKIVRGHRHNDALRTLHDMPNYKLEMPHGDNQGFITSKNRYVTRKEGMILQKIAGIKSVNKGGYWSDELYSEDLY